MCSDVALDDRPERQKLRRDSWTCFRLMTVLDLSPDLVFQKIPKLESLVQIVFHVVIELLDSARLENPVDHD